VQSISNFKFGANVPINGKRYASTGREQPEALDKELKKFQNNINQ